jgi:hypothetical protein
LRICCVSVVYCTAVTPSRVAYGDPTLALQGKGAQMRLRSLDALKHDTIVVGRHVNQLG